MNIKNILLCALVGAVVASLVLIGGRLVGDQSADFGGLGRNRFPNSGLIPRYVKIVNSPATSTAGADNSLYVQGTSTFVGAVVVPGITGTGALTGFTSGAFSTTLTVAGETNVSGFIQGGVKTTLTATSTAQELTAAQACNSSFIELDVSGTSSTLTMASTSLVVADCAPTTGDRFSFYLRNISGSGEYITIVSSSPNMELRETSGSDVIIQDAESAHIEYLITLASGTDSTSDVYVTSMQVAD